MTILDDIAVYKRREIAEAKSLKPLSVLEDFARNAGPVRGFRARLEERRRLGRFGLIAEIKKASPSKGLIRAEFAPAAIAQAYAEGGATCLSVLTDKPSFQGAPEYLIQARNACSLPVLRKDFMFEPYQVVEARAWGADCILIIMASVTDDEARILLETSRHWNMDTIVEVHDEAELHRALVLQPDMIGINNRDLRTFVTDLDVTLRLLPLVPSEILVIAESGLSSNADLQRMAGHGVTNFLIGESLMRQEDIVRATRALLGH